MSKNEGKERFIYCVTLDGAVVRWVVMNNEFVVSDEPDAMFHLNDLPRIRLVGNGTALEIDETHLVNRTPRATEKRVVYFNEVSPDGPDRWTPDREWAHAVAAAIRLGRKLGAEEARKEAVEAFKAIIYGKKA